MSLLLLLAAASVQTAPAPAPAVEAGAEPKTERVCKSVKTPDSRVAKKVCTRVKVKEPVVAEPEAAAEHDHAH